MTATLRHRGSRHKTACACLCLSHSPEETKPGSPYLGQVDGRVRSNWASCRKPVPCPSLAQTDSEFLRNFSERLNFTSHNLSLPLRSRAIMDAGQADVAAWPDWHCMTPTVAPRRRLFSSFPAGGRSLCDIFNNHTDFY